jgi:hypothetical protein
MLVTPATGTCHNQYRLATHVAKWPQICTAAGLWSKISPLPANTHGAILRAIWIWTALGVRHSCPFPSLALYHVTLTQTHWVPCTQRGVEDTTLENRRWSSPIPCGFSDARDEGRHPHSSHWPFLLQALPTGTCWGSLKKNILSDGHPQLNFGTLTKDERGALPGFPHIHSCTLAIEQALQRSWGQEKSFSSSPIPGAHGQRRPEEGSARLRLCPIHNPGQTLQLEESWGRKPLAVRL